jgi:hypothetical protein
MITEPTRRKTAFKSSRITKRATIVLHGTLDVVFPLFGPIMEKEWCDDWEPEMVFTTTNLIDEHMVFRTKGKFESEPFYTWVLTRYNPQNHVVEYAVSTQNRIWFIRVECHGLENKTLATISYTYTSLNEIGETYNTLSLEKMYSRNLEDWSDAINHYLQTGSKLTN